MGSEMTKVIRDKDGGIINIGEWDYGLKDEEITNPLPEGAVESDEEVDTMPDKSRIVKTDYEKKRSLEYPSIADQLDDIYHNGIVGWKAKIKVIKDKYPK